MTLRILFGLAVCMICVGHLSAIKYYYMEEYCYSTLPFYSMDQIRLQIVQFGNYKFKWDCKVTIAAPSSYRMMVYFKDIDIEFSTNCTNDYLKMYGEDSVNSPELDYKRRYCGYSSTSTVFTTSSSILFIYFRSDSNVTRTGFDIIITKYETGSCHSWEHECSNGRCINESLSCNGYNPCGDHSDCDVNVAVIVGSAIGGTVILVVFIVIFIVVRRRGCALARRAAPVKPKRNSQWFGQKGYENHKETRKPPIQSPDSPQISTVDRPMSAVSQYLGKTLTSRYHRLKRSGLLLQQIASISKKQYNWPEVDENDIETQFVRGGGPGGQAVAKTSNCVILKHKPTGIVVRSHDTRSQFENHKIAKERLKYHLDIYINKENSFDAISKREKVKEQAIKKQEAKKLLDLKKAFKKREGLD